MLPGSNDRTVRRHVAEECRSFGPAERLGALAEESVGAFGTRRIYDQAERTAALSAWCVRLLVAGSGLSPMTAYDPEQPVGLSQSSHSITRFSDGSEARTTHRSVLLNHLIRALQQRWREGETRAA